MIRAIFYTLLLAAATIQADSLPTLRVGSKPFTEGYIIGELIAQTIDEVGEARAVRKLGLGGVGIIFQALTSGALDIAPEYVGTVTHAMLHKPSLNSLEKLHDALDVYQLDASTSLGYASSQGLVMRKDRAQDLGIQRISDLQHHTNLRAGFHHDFLERADGWPGLIKRYRIELAQVYGLSHSFAYEALDKHTIDVTEAYLTDAKISQYDLVLLEDDQNFFPDYTAFLLARKEIRAGYPKTWEALKALASKLSFERVQQLNKLVEVDHWSYEQAAAHFLRPETAKSKSTNDRWWRLTRETTLLVLLAVLASIAIGLPLGVLCGQHPSLARILLTGSGLVQTIPSMALLCLFIPLLGIGTPSAVVALILYGLLPIVRGTYLGLNGIDQELIETARALGLSRRQRLLRVELPLAAPSIMAGIKTSATISVGTATLAALIGAGGYGDLILTGLAVHNTSMLMTGVWSAALFSLLLQGTLELLDRLVIPMSLR